MSVTKGTASARRTEQRRVLQSILEASERPLSVHEILELAQKKVATLGLATVYRNLKSFVEDGWLAAVALPGEAVRYELASKKHHHHFHCESCQRIFDIPHCVRSLDTGLPRGFVVERHEILLHGLCPDCRMPG